MATNSLYRYTSISVLLDMLMKKRLFLSNPKSWPDKTDAAFLEKYAEGKDIKALCFFKKPESNQYWELYAKYGCMIEFETKKLLDKISSKKDFIHGNVSYVKQNNFSLEKYNKKLPFIKQFRYKSEAEYRVVCTGENKEMFIPIDLNSIKRISISGDIKEEIADSLIVLIRKRIGKTLANKIEISHSRLYENKVWLKKINPPKGGQK